MMRQLFLLICLFQSCLFFANPAPLAPPVDLAEALRQKWIKATVQGLGGHQGESLKIVCKNLSGKYLRIRVPQGQLMAPADSNEQTLVVAEDLIVSLTTKSPAEGLLKTFCTEAGDRSPNVNATFAVGAMAAEPLCKLLKFMVEKGKLTSPDAQTAVWCLTGRQYGLAAIDDPELARFTAELKGASLPGYKVKYKPEQQVPGRPAALGKAMVVEGNFTYYLEKDEITQMVLLDSAGQLIRQVSKDERMKAGEHRSGMRLEVYNLDAGKYTLRMQTKAGRVIKDWNIEF